MTRSRISPRWRASSSAYATAGSTARTAARRSRASTAPGQEDTSRIAAYEVDASEPPVLLGHNEAPNPAEYLLHALAGCLTLTIVNVAAARKVTLTEVSSTLEGVLDARGALGLDDDFRNGFERISVSFAIAGEASTEKLQEIVERAKARSVVYDIVTNGVPVDVEAEVV